MDNKLIGSIALCAAVALIPAAASAAAGDEDTTFGPQTTGGGRVTTVFSTEKDAVYGLALQPDNKIVAVGVSGDKIALARYNADGGLDPGFGQEGKKTTHSGSRAEGRAVAVQPDGKIVVAGLSDEGESGTYFALRRYLPDGKNDGAFGYGGGVTTRISSEDDAAYAVAVQGDGKILAVGSGHDEVALVRYNPDGSPDNGFGDRGLVTTKVGKLSHGSAVALQKDGKIVVAGSSMKGSKDSDMLVLRYGQDGEPDASFGGKGATTIDLGSGKDAAHGVAVTPDGKIIAAGGDGEHFAVACLTATGRLDEGFGKKGLTGSAIGGSATGRGVALQQDGKIVVAGYERSDATGDSVAVSRYTADGKQDAGFGDDGVAKADFGTPSDRGHAVAVQPDGKILVGGRSHDPIAGDSFALVRFLGA